MDISNLMYFQSFLWHQKTFSQFKPSLPKRSSHKKEDISATSVSPLHPKKDPSQSFAPLALNLSPLPTSLCYWIGQQWQVLKMGLKGAASTSKAVVDSVTRNQHIVYILLLFLNQLKHIQSNTKPPPQSSFCIIVMLPCSNYSLC